MQVFVPYNNILQVVKEMACDKRRYNKQIVECNQIIKAIKGKTEAWKNHPICHQYKNYVKWLEWYKFIFEEYRNNNYIFSEEQKNKLLSWKPTDVPPFLENESYLNSHKRRLYQKAPELYPQFEMYNDKNDQSNWYCVPINFNVPKRKGVSFIDYYGINGNYKIVRYK